MKCLAVLSVFVFASVCSASVFDDAQFLLQGDADVNGDGIITQGEARNALDRNSANPLELDVCGSVDGVDRGISCPETEIDLPRRGETVSGKVIRLRTLTRKSDFDGVETVWASGFYMNSSYPLSTEMTAVMRFRWDGFVMKSGGDAFEKDRAVLINYGGCWDERNDGITLSIAPKGGKPVLRVEGTHIWLESNLAVKPDTWYDFAMTAQKGVLRLYLLPAAGNAPMSMEKMSCSVGVFNETFAKTHFSVGTFASSSSYNQFLPPDSWTDWRQTDEAEDSFNGDLHQVALWTRVLSDDEIEEAFIGSASDLQAGVENGSNGEFSASSSSALGSGSGWHRAKGALSSRGETVDFAFRNEPGRSFSRIVSCWSCAGTSASVSLLLNGTAVGSPRIFGGARCVTWLLPGDSLAEGENRVSLRMEADGAFLLDALQITGGFKLVSSNEPNNSSDAVSTHLLDRNVYNFNENLTAWATLPYTNRIFRFNLPRSYPKRYGQLWTVRRSQWTGQIAGPCDVWANGQCVYHSGTSLPMVFSFVIPADNLVEGLNTVVLRNLSEQTLDDERQGYYILKEITVEPYSRPNSLIMILR